MHAISIISSKDLTSISVCNETGQSLDKTMSWYLCFVLQNILIANFPKQSQNAKIWNLAT